MKRCLRRLLTTALALLAIAAPALGVVPSAIHEAEIEGPSSWETPRSAELRSGRDGDAVLDSFQARYGGTWRMIRNLATGTAEAVYGSGIPLAADGQIADAGEAEALARAFIDANPALFGVASADLVLGDAAFGLDKWGVNFYQTVNGVRVFRSKVTLVFHENGRLYAFMSDAYATGGVSTAPALAREAAATIARDAIGFVATRDAEAGTDLILLPILEEGRAVLRLAHKIDLRVAQPYGLWSTYVDATDGTVLWRENNYKAIDITGTVVGSTPEFNVCDGLQTLSNRNQRVKEDAVGNSIATDSLTGAWSLVVPDSTPRQITFRLVGRNPTNFFTVINANGPEAADTVLATPGVPLDFVWDDTNSRLDERSVWVHSNRVHDYIKNVDLAFTAMDFNATMSVNNIGDGCPGNAFWIGTGAEFCAAGASFGNTGEIGDVVYHEYGHGVNSRVYAGFPFNGALSEGQADVLANLVNEDPVIGDGFFYPTCRIGIRNSNNAFVIADTLSMSQSHERGQIMAGFWWDLRGRLIESHEDIVAKSPDNAGKLLAGELWHFCRRLTKPFNEVPMALGTFIVDDDDGNLDNGTPNYDDICFAATGKGFTCPTISEGVAIAHAGLMSTTDEVSPRNVSAMVASLSGGIDPSSVTLHYRVNESAFTQIGMTDGGGGAYSASIPAQAQPSVVEYYLSAMDSTGAIGYSPTAAQDATPDTSDTAVPVLFERLHAYDVCTVYDPCEVVGDWQPHATGSTAVGGVWELGIPSASNNQPGYDMTPDTGVNCFVTGAASGNVNKGFTILKSPVWNLAGNDSVVAKVRRWFVNDVNSDVARMREENMITEASNDSGQTWITLENTNEGLKSFQEREWNLSDAFGEATAFVQFRFTVYDTGTVNVVEALVDEVRISAKSSLTDVASGDASSRPLRYALHANQPNPFNPSTTIRYDLPRESAVEIAIYNTSGQRVRTLVRGAQPAGRHAALWNGRNERDEVVSSGVYIYRMETKEFTGSGKMMLVK